MNPAARATPTPLAGVRIVTIAQNVPGPVAVARLVAEGATAVKVEPPWGDPLASMCRPWYDELHAGIEVRHIDLKSAAGARALDALLAEADVFVSGHRPSALARLGLDPPAVTRRFPGLRYLAMVGDTAHPEGAGHDLTYQATAGLLGEALPATLLADLMGAAQACTSVLLLLRDPPGSTRHVGLFDGLHGLTAPTRHGLTGPGGALGGGRPEYGVYETLEGRVAVAALEPHFRERLYEGLGLPDDGDLGMALRERTAIEWERWAAGRDIPMAAVRTVHPSTSIGASGDTETRR